MKNISLFCLSLNPGHLNKIKSLGFSPVGLGNSNFSNEWLRDNTGQNISQKNNFYGEYTFHYWLWKNKINELSEDWIGFCQYRKFWSLTKLNNTDLTFENFKKNILKNIPKELDNYESIIGEPFFVNQFRFTKFIKRNFYKMISNPSLIFLKHKRNIKFHFDMWHGDGNLEKAINLLEKNEKDDFINFVNNNVSFNPHNMFICKSKKTLKKYYESVFPWLEKCEREFGFDDLEGYGMKRIYGFLAERYMSYWFQKYTKYKTLPIIFKDLSDF